VPEETCFDPADRAVTIPSIFPALVKPACGDSSIGITQQAVVHDAEELVDRLRVLREQLPGVPVLVQEFLPGTEFTVGVIGNPGLSHEVLPLLEVDYAGLDAGLAPILSWESKWEPDSPYWTQIRYVESKAPVEVKNRILDASILLFQKLGCRDYARFDFRADADGVPKLLEVNPNPGWCWDGKMNLMAELAGWSYADFLGRILEAAQERVAAGRELHGSGIEPATGASPRSPIRTV
jgi:D-alanine-D-alanine ligase